MPAGAVLLDVGGVLTLPHPRILGDALDAADVPHDRLRLEVAHYHGVAAMDLACEQRSIDDGPDGYIEGWLDGLRVPADRRHRGATVLREVLSRPSVSVWSALTPWAHPGLAALGASGLPLAVVSNSDGSVEAVLAEHRLCQVGPGAGTEVVEIVDSTLVGVAKPDPGIFEPAVEAVGVPPEDCWYVGDTVSFDVAGAEAAGLTPLHLDPFDSCPRGDHRHVADLVEVVALLDAVTNGR